MKAFRLISGRFFLFSEFFAMDTRKARKFRREKGDWERIVSSKKMVVL